LFIWGVIFCRKWREDIQLIFRKHAYNLTLVASDSPQTYNNSKARPVKPLEQENNKKL